MTIGGADGTGGGDDNYLISEVWLLSAKNEQWSIIGNLKKAIRNTSSILVGRSICVFLDTLEQLIGKFKELIYPEMRWLTLLSLDIKLQNRTIQSFSKFQMTTVFRTNSNLEIY